MPFELTQYHNAEVAGCHRCSNDPTLAAWMTYKKPIPFEPQADCPVLILGHSPTVRTGKTINTVLDLDQDGPLRQYLETDILNPLGLKLDQCAATNVVKCFTPQPLEDVEADDTPMMKRAFEMCRFHLEQEIQRLKPSLVISLSQRVLHLLSEHYLGVTLTMKGFFGSWLYLPFAHCDIKINSERSSLRLFGESPLLDPKNHEYRCQSLIDSTNKGNYRLYL